MKFSNGCWLQKEGCACFSPAEVYFTKIEKDKVVLCAPTHKINHRGDTLGGINLTVEITTPMPEVIRVKTYHYKGAIQDGPQFALNLPKQTAIDATEDDEKIVVKSGNAKLVITKENWSMTYYNGDKKLSTSAWRDLAYMKTDWKGDAYVKSADKDAYMRQQLSLGVGELIYGLGERFAAFTRNGQSIDIWNEDGGTSTDQSYKNIPFYISNKGYGVFVNHTEKVSFEVATEAVTKVEFSVPGESLDYFFFNGPDLKDVLRRYTDLTGKPALPPAWTFGLWLSTSFTTNYDEKTVMSFFHWTDFLWDERVFPDPEGMLSRMKAKGLKICVWINPYIAQESVMFDEGMEGGYFLKRPDGSVWQWDMWQPGMAIVDFTNPEAKKWYQKKLEALRSATAGGQKFPVHWGGDCWSDYESMEESLRGGLSLQLSGFGFWSHDIGGFENTSTADVYKRWCAFGLLSSHSRLHGSTSYRVPWAYDDEAVDVLRSFVRLKARLMPYLWKTALTAHNEGIPSMRAMVLSYTNDKMCNYLDKQYMLGDSLLVAPIFNDEGIGEYYLPKENGIWTDFFTGRQQEGGDWYTRTYAYTEIPLMVRPNTVLPLGNSEEGPEYDYADQVTFRVYDVQDEAAAEIYDMDQNKVASIVVKRIEDKLVIDCDSKKPFTVELVNTGILDVKGAKASKENKNTILRDCESHIECIQ